MGRFNRDLFKDNLYLDRCIKFFFLPDCYLNVIKDKECKKSRVSVARDLLEIFFSYNGPCRLWDVDKSEWKYYYGSNYHAHQRARLLATVQPQQYEILFRDKAVCEILCRGIGIKNIPHTYGIISPDQNYTEKIEL